MQETAPEPEFQFSEEDLREALSEEGNIIPELVVNSLRNFNQRRERAGIEADEDYMVCAPRH